MWEPHPSEDSATGDELSVLEDFEPSPSEDEDYVIVPCGTL